MPPVLERRWMPVLGPSVRSASSVSYCLSVNFGHSFHLSNKSGSGMRLGVKVALVLLVLGGAMYLFVFPARTCTSLRSRASRPRRGTVAVLRAEDAKLTSESSALQDNATIEQIARQQYGLVKQGQQAFMVLPAGQAVPRRRPHRRPSRRLGTLPWSSGTTCSRTGKEIDAPTAYGLGAPWRR